MAAGSKKKARSLFRRTLIIMLCAACAAGALVYAAIARLERGVLDVCAVQQDAYVQLVLDQIALQGEQGDASVIEDILGSLDASSSKYWVFSRGETMLFVKDVTETNKYKGFTAATYYDSDSARAFLDSLTVGYVRHDSIRIGDKRYLASGATFVYSGDEYRLCLLTNRDLLLENNAYLRVKSELWVLLLALLVLVVAVPAALARRADILRRQRDENGEAIAMLQRQLSAMDERLSNRDWQEPAASLWQLSALVPFAERLAERDVSCVSFARVLCDRGSDRMLLLRRASNALPASALRFACGKRGLVVLFLRADGETARRYLEPLVGTHARLDGDPVTARTADEMLAAAQEFSKVDEED